MDTYYHSKLVSHLELVYLNITGRYDTWNGHLQYSIRLMRYSIRLSPCCICNLVSLSILSNMTWISTQVRKPMGDISYSHASGSTLRVDSTLDPEPRPRQYTVYPEPPPRQLPMRDMSCLMSLPLASTPTVLSTLSLYPDSQT